MIRRHLYLILTFILISYYSIGQTNNIKITYNVEKFIDEESELEKIYLSTFKNFQAIFDELEFSLMINTEKSIFFLKDKLYSDKYTADLALSTIEYFGRIEQRKDHFITENLEEDFGRFLVKRSYQNWVLYKEETKMIDNYLCFKATTSYTVTNIKGKVFTHNFTAWYSPELPYNYGPIGYGNLPGLILELQADDFTYGVSKIEFFEQEDKKLKMPKLKKLKIITDSELEQLAEKDEEKRRKRND